MTDLPPMSEPEEIKALEYRNKSRGQGRER